MTRTVADQMVETLAAAGVEHIYRIVGDSLNGFTDALRRRGGVELSALIEALARHAVDTPETKLHVGPLELDLIERTAKRGDRSIDLLPREFRLLEYMMRRKGRVLTRSSERCGSTSSFQRPASWTCIWAGFGARSMGRMSRL